MPIKVKEMPAAMVARLKKPGYHRVGVISGLCLQVGSGDSARRSWVLRVKVGKRKRDIGLGSYPEVSLEKAREEARKMKAMIRLGVDPAEERRKAREALLAQQAAEDAAAALRLTFAKAEEGHFNDKIINLKNPKHRAQWRSTMKTYAFPFFKSGKEDGDMDVSEITVQHVVDCLKPIWLEVPETAHRVRGRIERILDWAGAKGHRSGLNPARWDGSLEHLLPKQDDESKSFAAMPFGEVRSFMDKLKGQAGQGARAVELAVLTACRSGEVRNARWSQFDLDSGLWTIPKEFTKTKKEHKAIITPAIVELLSRIEKHPESDLLFANKKGGTLSDMTLTSVLKRMELPFTVHGFRSCFKDWASETTDFPNEVSEMALAHVISNKVEAAYRRGELIEKRTKLMEAWAAHCGR